EARRTARGPSHADARAIRPHCAGREAASWKTPPAPETPGGGIRRPDPGESPRAAGARRTAGRSCVEIKVWLLDSAAGSALQVDAPLADAQVEVQERGRDRPKRPADHLRQEADGGVDEVVGPVNHRDPEVERVRPSALLTRHVLDARHYHVEDR